MGRLESLPALRRKNISYKSFILQNEPVPSQFPVPTVRFGLCSKVLQNILTCKPWENIPGHRISNICASKAVGLVSQKIAWYCC